MIRNLIRDGRLGVRANLRIYIGAYTSDFGAVKGNGRGISCYDLDPLTGALSKLSEIVAENPSHLAPHPSGRFLYAANEVAHVVCAPDNSISAFKIAGDGTLCLINQQPSLGGGPCFVSVTPDGKFVLTSNYEGGNIVMYPILADGRLAAASDTVRHSDAASRAAHAHSINIAPGGKYALACDLGLDRVFVYEIDRVRSKLLLRSTADLAHSSGPRHLAFHPNMSYVYVINELNSTLTVFQWDEAVGRLAEVQTISTVPADFIGTSWCADVHVHPNGKFVYGSNRGHDSLAIYDVNQADGRLALLGHESTRGAWPRSFALSPAGDLLLVANQNSDTVVVFRVDVITGQLTHLATNEVPTPVCLKFA
jgi:6-phosphogluconolactonase